MNTTRMIATVVTSAALSLCGTELATAGDNYVFPSANGVQLQATPAATFIAPANGASAQPNTPGVSVGSAYVYGQPDVARHQKPPPAYAAGQTAPYSSRFMGNTFLVAPYANYAADYARLFAPNYAVSAWTDRVFGIVESGYTAVDGWTASAYGLSHLQAPRRRGESAPDLTLMPTFRAHPDLSADPTFKHQGN